VETIAVSTPAEMDRFIRLPAALYGADPNFVPPLLLEREEALSPKKNPYFQHAEAKFWLARRDGRDVGRISAQIDRLVKDPEVGHFGMLVAETTPRRSRPVRGRRRVASRARQEARARAVQPLDQRGERLSDRRLRHAADAADGP
jgi:hypothetical protein